MTTARSPRGVSNARGGARWATRILLAWVLLALGADFISSEHPIVMRRGGETYLFPNLISYPALRGQGAAELSSTLGPDDWALWTPVRHGPTEVRGADGVHALARPSWQHLLGTDDRGRDVVARLVHGARSSAFLALAAALGALALALLLALFAVRFGGVIDQGVVFGTGTLSAVPIFVLVIAAQGLLGASGLWVAAAMVALPRGADTARLIRASLLVTEASTYAAASRASGASRWRVLLSHGVRDSLGVIVVATALTVSTAVLAEAALGFLGVGVAPPTPSWGELLRQAYENGFPLTMTVPAGLILVAIAAALDRATESASL